MAVGGVGAIQGGVNDIGAWAFDIEKRNPADIGRRWNDFVVGAGTGAVLGLGGLAVTRAPEKPPQPPPEKPGVILDKSLGKQEVPPPDLHSPEVLSHDARPSNVKIPKELGELTSVPRKLPGSLIELGDHIEFDALIWKQGNEVTVRVNMIRGKRAGFTGLLRKSKEIAKLNGADTVRIESLLANDTLEMILKKRYGMISREEQINGDFDILVFNVK